MWKRRDITSGTYERTRSMRIAVCDDETEFIETTLKPIIARAGELSGAETDAEYFSDGEELYGEFEKEPFDIVILDIEMPKINGKQLAAKLRLISSGFFLVFVTSYRQEVFNIIPYRVNAFITKDSPPDAAAAELARVMREYLSLRPAKEVFDVMINGEKTALALALGDIFFFRCVKRKAYLNTSSKEYELCAKRFSDIEKRFIPKGFYEVCRGYIVNIEKVSLVGKNYAELDGGVRVPLSRGRCEKLKTALSQYISREADAYWK